MALLHFFRFKLSDDTKAVTYRTMFTLHIKEGLQVHAVPRRGLVEEWNTESHFQISMYKMSYLKLIYRGNDCPFLHMNYKFNYSQLCDKKVDDNVSSCSWFCLESKEWLHISEMLHSEFHIRNLSFIFVNLNNKLKSRSWNHNKLPSPIWCFFYLLLKHVTQIESITFDIIETTKFYQLDQIMPYKDFHEADFEPPSKHEYLGWANMA